ncbi:MAG: phosphoenolpyruvate carboxykinase (GTP) [Syntrophotaleaceae bacterium]
MRKSRDCAGLQLLKDCLDETGRSKLGRIDNAELNRFLAETVALCRPDRVRICDDGPEDRDYLRRRALAAGEEIPLATEGHTVHFDAFSNGRQHDQSRDKANTRFLAGDGNDLGEEFNTLPRRQGLEEIRERMAGSMSGKEMIVRFYCLGPNNSPFSLPCVQLTDSPYVAHCEDILFRPGYETFRSLAKGDRFFRMLHSNGRTENGVSADLHQRRVIIDLAEDLVYSVNTQYAGNSVGLKKPALRLAIRRANQEGWLAEHMFLMGVHGPGGRTTYFSGAYPSACGKTSTAMVPGETILADDLIYIRAMDGRARAVNVEQGILGIIEGVNPADDPELFRVLHTPGEVIFSNVLVAEGRPYWIGMGEDLPAEGFNYAGAWFRGKRDSGNLEIAPSYKGNARYTVALSPLANLDPRAEDPQGVPLEGIIYGGRDSDTAVPVQESFDWIHGIVTMGAALESETTAAALETQGVRKCNPMAILDFLSIPLGRYLRNNLDFCKKLERPPRIFATNYWLKDAAGRFLNGKLDKAVWLKWMELRVHDEVSAIEAPTGRIPYFEDLERLFRQVFNKTYSREDYAAQFGIRLAGNLEKIERILTFYAQVPEMPPELAEVLTAQKERLLKWHALKGDVVSPCDLE